MVKELLSRERLSFSVRNIEEDPGAFEELLAMGFKVVPVTIIDGQAITGYDEHALRRAIAAAVEP
jgi:glutaredoxin